MSGARNARDINIWTDRLLRPSRTAISSASFIFPAAISCIQSRPSATARTREERTSDRMGRSSPTTPSAGSRTSRFGLPGLGLPRYFQHRRIFVFSAHNDVQCAFGYHDAPNQRQSLLFSGSFQGSSGPISLVVFAGAGLTKLPIGETRLASRHPGQRQTWWRQRTDPRRLRAAGSPSGCHLRIRH